MNQKELSTLRQRLKLLSEDLQLWVDGAKDDLATNENDKKEQIWLLRGRIKELEHITA